MAIRASRNTDWDRMSPKAKKIVIDSLPFPYPVIISIIFLILYAPPYLMYLFYKEFEFTIYIQWSLIIIFFLYIISATMNNYFKKTGKNLSDDLYDIENKYKTEDSGLSESNIKDAKHKTFFLSDLIWFIVPWSTIIVALVVIPRTKQTPPPWVYFLIVMMFVFPFFVLMLLKKSRT